MCITVVVTVTKAHVNADDKPHAPDNLIYFHLRTQRREREKKMRVNRKKKRGKVIETARKGINDIKFCCID